MKLLVIGDVVGERALEHLRRTLPQKRAELGAHLVIANGENVCDIHGLSPATAQALLDCGVDFITSGNHIFDRRDIYGYLDESHTLIRPANYPPEAPGEGARIVTSADGWNVLVINVSGTVFMDALGNPFAAVQHALDAAGHKYDVAVLDVHAEATSEKMAIARCFDGKLAAVWGTHTHVQTADEQILPNGTGYITDLGMTGPIDSILGVSPESVIGKLRTHMPHRFTVAGGEIRACGALFEIDPIGNRTTAVRRITF